VVPGAGLEPALALRRRDFKTLPGLTSGTNSFFSIT